MLSALAEQHCPIRLQEAVESLQKKDQAGHYSTQTWYVIQNNCAEICGAAVLSGCVQGGNQAGHYSTQTWCVIQNKCPEGSGTVALSGWVHFRGDTGGDTLGILGGYRGETGRIRWGEASAKQHLQFD